MTQRCLSEQTRIRIEEMARQYASRRSLALPAAWAAQYEGGGTITSQSMEEVAEIVGITPAEVQEIVSFYTMYRRKATGRFTLMVCKTLSCAAAGAEGLLGYLSEKLQIEPGETTPDGLFSLEAVECLGACAWAPVMLVNEHLHVRLTRAKVDEILEQCRANPDQAELQGKTNINAAPRPEGRDHAQG